jgi:hypothetical protein
MGTKLKRRPGAAPTETRANAFLAFARNDGASDATVASEVGVSRQRVSLLRQQWKNATASKSESENGSETASAIENGQSTVDVLHENQFPARPASAAQFATSGSALGGDRLAMGASLVFFMVEWPDWAEAPEVIAARFPKSLDADRLQALVTYRMNATSRAGSFKAVGIDTEVGADMYQRDRELRRVLDWAAGLAEVRIASNMLRLATGVGPQAAQAATLIAERQLGWTKENVLRIEGDLEHHIDMTAILSDPVRIRAVNQFERAMQEAEAAQLPVHENVIEGEVIDLEAIEPRVEELRPKLPDDEMTRAREPIEVRPRMNRPGQGDPSKLGRTREVLVDGIRTLMVDERAPGDDKRPPF